MFRQQFRKEYLNVLFWASIPLFVLSYSCRPTRYAWIPHLQINLKKMFLLPTRRHIYQLRPHAHCVYLLFWSPLVTVIIPEVREPRPHMWLLEDHQRFRVRIFRLCIPHCSQKCHTVCLVVTQSVLGVDEPPEPCLQSVESAQIDDTVGENCTNCVLFGLLAIYHEITNFNLQIVPFLPQNRHRFTNRRRVLVLDNKFNHYRVANIRVDHKEKQWKR